MSLQPVQETWWKCPGFHLKPRWLAASQRGHEAAASLLLLPGEAGSFPVPSPGTTCHPSRVRSFHFASGGFKNRASWGLLELRRRIIWCQLMGGQKENRKTLVYLQGSGGNKHFKDVGRPWGRETKPLIAGRKGETQSPEAERIFTPGMRGNQDWEMQCINENCWDCSQLLRDAKQGNYV